MYYYFVPNVYIVCMFPLHDYVFYYKNYLRDKYEKNQKSSFLARSDRKQTKLATYFYFKSHVNVIEWAYQFHGSKKSTFVIEL